MLFCSIEFKHIKHKTYNAKIQLIFTIIQSILLFIRCHKHLINNKIKIYLDLLIMIGTCIHYIYVGNKIFCLLFYKKYIKNVRHFDESSN